MVLASQHAVRSFAFVIALFLATSGAVAHATEAHLVHCGSGTCLRLSGDRRDAALEVRVGGYPLAAAEGGRHWQATVPLALARSWTTSSDDALPVTFADAHAGTEHTETVLLPPGALGRQVELVALMVRAG